MVFKKILDILNSKAAFYTVLIGGTFALSSLAAYQYYEKHNHTRLAIDTGARSRYPVGSVVITD
jgi:hypothetical protein